jgi:fluoroacetyl-CoA thioesterase
MQLGLSARVSLTVGRSDTAISHRSGDVPALATPRVLALMEQAAVQAIAGAMEPGQTTVGFTAELTHSAATPVGGRVEAEAKVTAIEGAKVDFEITVTDLATGSEVARASHRRVVVDYDRFIHRLSHPRGTMGDDPPPPVS